MVIRITGGQCKGRTITGPSGREARPTASKIRQAFFNILGHKISHCRFLDLFAGIGSMGLESLSRGAGLLLSVEEQPRLAQTIKTNLRLLGYEGQVITGDVRQVLPQLEKHGYDVIFADPPYRSQLAESLPETVHRYRLLDPAGWLVIEHARNNILVKQAGDLTLSDSRSYGQTTISFYRYPG